ncbi:hypothetical protein A1Q1_07704 [Trichosporon asahii var. asahii CBS 2479]|uniref:Phosphomevalonate kinase n=1 Tax=Trichosporon asahii var. asahii (strain ATCC 90039 / CBS 2479 / JCM 2466 / KCTC 7840 / NBRC 103889/ NCYC 2677 / UAMH 7654) TaxID=1186058 RepID=J6F2B7_TRIAS|nr:hypothetical protein A1Q1_07704 [Trichosporon asahii var. asahii CBS 2479]EJT51109.1 hypothetical protein A1Q1_07704 [Trichosporon asahii var. asahii CBS 2479]
MSAGTTPTTTGEQTIVSAPGKVLLAGGYLVLDRLYTGLVVATSSRFYCSVAPGQAGIVSVRAGQFPADASVWKYAAKVANGKLDLQAAGDERNKFVQTTLQTTLEYAAQRLEREGRASELSAVLEKGLDIVVFADNDFYSQREQLAAAGLPLKVSSLDKLERFTPLPRPLGKTNKTGLGSSAALVTSLVAALLLHLGLAVLPTGQDTIHALAQAAHCAAQGKVGSGFDVASAVYGTHVYRRFSPSVLEPMFTGTASLLDIVSGMWDQETRPFRLPRGLRLMLADVDAGTDTPSFVGQVLKWRKEKSEEALRMWTVQDAANKALEEALRGLAQLENEPGYTETLQAAIGQEVANLKHIRGAIEGVRKGMRDMSLASGVPIEPKEQTRLLDECSKLPGVLGGGVPGAGGYDAIWLLAIDDPSSLEGVERVWEGWTEMSVCPLSARQSDGGLQREQPEVLAAALARK